MFRNSIQAKVAKDFPRTGHYLNGILLCSSELKDILVSWATDSFYLSGWATVEW